MTIQDFTEQQKQALLDLATLAMYADGHLASAEDERVRRLLGKMGFRAEYDCNREYDAAITRIRPHFESAANARAYAEGLAQIFSSREQRLVVLEMLDDVVTSDRHVSLQESDLISSLREILERVR
jgi:uncharacterized tellurite resistance protein B-like protein